MSTFFFIDNGDGSGARLAYLHTNSNTRLPLREARKEAEKLRCWKSRVLKDDFVSPWSVLPDEQVEDGKQFPHDGGDDDLEGFASGGEAFGEAFGDQKGVTGTEKGSLLNITKNYIIAF